MFLLQGLGLLVFPAHAGVSPHTAAHPISKFGFPRTRGGEPVGKDIPFMFAPFSPHTRG